MSSPNILECSAFLKQTMVVMVTVLVTNLALGKYFILLLHRNNLF